MQTAYHVGVDVKEPEVNRRVLTQVDDRFVQQLDVVVHETCQLLVGIGLRLVFDYQAVHAVLEQSATGLPNLADRTLEQKMAKEAGVVLASEEKVEHAICCLFGRVDELLEQVHPFGEIVPEWSNQVGI